MKNIEAIVKKAIGYDEARGDQVEVINMPFQWATSEEDTKSLGGESWKEYILISYKPLVSLILAVLFIFFVVRPLLKKRIPLPKEEGAYLPKMSAPQPAALPPEMPREGKSLDLRQQTAQLVQENPSKVVGIIKEWINEKGENP
jgi:flagellar M-ring protein FliF